MKSTLCCASLCVAMLVVAMLATPLAADDVLLRDHYALFTIRTPLQQQLLGAGANGIYAVIDANWLLAADTEADRHVQQFADQLQSLAGAAAKDRDIRIYLRAAGTFPHSRLTSSYVRRFEQTVAPITLRQTHPS